MNRLVKKVGRAIKNFFAPKLVLKPASVPVRASDPAIRVRRRVR